jgi:ethanolamine utilization protein EutA
VTHSVKLIGLDFGTTTSSAVVATAELAHNAVTDRSDLSQLRESYRSGMVFTPMRGESLDLERLNEYLDEWLCVRGVQRAELFGGGALLTGLTAQKRNAAGLVRLVERRLEWKKGVEERCQEPF